MFKYPQEHQTDNVQLYWKTPRKSNFNTYVPKYPDAYIFQPNATFVEEQYRGKTKLIGNIKNRNCSLKICKITATKPNIYLTIIAKGDNSGLRARFVSISVSGKNSILVAI